MNNSHFLVVSPPPHIHSRKNLQKLMLDFIIALIPAFLFAIYVFGYSVIKIVIISILSSVMWELIFQKLTNKKLTYKNLSAVVSGFIFSMILPPTAPWWLIILGTLLMIGLGREVYGGYGTNPFNGVLIAWVILRLSFPSHMFEWIVPTEAVKISPMQLLKDQGPDFVYKYYSLKDLIIAHKAGFIGHASSLLVFIGGIYLLIRKTINWRIPFGFLAGVLVFSFLCWFISAGEYIDPLFHLLAGGTMLGAFFLATDYPSSPVTPQGMFLFGLFAGILTVIIRTWGHWTFGAYYAILIMSLATPFLDKLMPEPYGRY